MQHINCHDKCVSPPFPCQVPNPCCIPEPPGPAGTPNTSYAQYGVTANPSPNSFLPFFQIFESGSLTSLPQPHTIMLEAGYIYLINCIFLATPEENNYFQIVPFINNTAQLLYSTFAPANLTRNASASANFTTNLALESPAILEFSLRYPTSTPNIDISGAVSITPVAVQSL